MLTDWSSDGRYILFSAGASGGSELWLLPMSGGAKPSLFLNSLRDIMHANLSPNGRSMAYTSNESGQFEVWVETVRGRTRRSRSRSAADTNPGGGPTREDLLSVGGSQVDGGQKVAPDFSFGSPRVLFQTRVAEEFTLTMCTIFPAATDVF